MDETQAVRNQCETDKRGITLIGWLSLLIVGVSIVVVVAFDWTNILVVPLAAIPPLLIVYFVYYSWLREAENQDDMFLRIFGAAFLPGACIALLCETAASAVFSLICIPGQLKDVMNELAHQEESGSGPYSRPVPTSAESTPGYYIFIILTAYITAATIEEILKAAVVRCSCGINVCIQSRHTAATPRHLAYSTIALLLAATLGFSTAENLLYIFGSSMAPTNRASMSNVAGRAMIAVVRGAVSMPVHCICAAFTALRLTLRDAQRNRQDVLSLAAERNGLYMWVPRNGGVPVETTCPSEARFAGPTGSIVRIKSKQAAAKEADSFHVWSWPRVLWPAIVVHGTFDFQAMILGVVLHKDLGDAKLTLLTLLVGLSVQLLALWILRQQFIGVFERIAAGDMPEAITIGVHWLCCGAPEPKPADGVLRGYPTGKPVDGAAAQSRTAEEVPRGYVTRRAVDGKGHYAPTPLI